MINKIFLVLFVLAILILGWFFIDSLFNSKEQEPITNEPQEYIDYSTSFEDSPYLPPSPPKDDYTDLPSGKILLKNRVGNANLIQGNFGNSDVITLDDGFGELFTPPSEEEAKWFDIYYDEPSDSLTVYLHWEPLKTARDMATKTLLEKLNLPIEELCQLEIQVQTNQHVSVEFAGYENLGLSFCPDSVQLP